MTLTPVFDMSRTNTAISPASKVHITCFHGSATICGIRLADLPFFTRDDWVENLDDQQPSCKRCLALARRWPMEAYSTRWIAWRWK